MKKFNVLAVLALSAMLFTTSCSKDDDTTDNDPVVVQNNTENDPIALSALKSGIQIDGATKNTGTPPASNSTLDFQLNTSKSSAYQSTGFDVDFTSTAAISGVYIQIKDTNGNPTGEYFDVPASEFSTFRLNPNAITHRKQRGIKQRRMDDNEIVVKFDDTIPAGKFCYEICVYDDSNNVSEPQEVCITVVDWGGNTDAIGEWIAVNDIDFNLVIDVNCANGEVLTNIPFYEEFNKDEHLFVLNADGNYYEMYDQDFLELDQSSAENNCTLKYLNGGGKEKYIGKWAYNEDEGTLTVVDFSYEDLLEPAQNEVYENGSVYFEGAKVEIISNQLILDDGGYIDTFNRR